MKFVEGIDNNFHTLELSRRNLIALLSKLDDSNSVRTLISPGARIVVRAVEDAEHYSDRTPGMVYMPTTGETY